MQGRADEQGRCAMLAETTAPATTHVHKPKTVPDTVVSIKQVRVPFGTSLPVVGRPLSPPAFAVPTIPQGRQLRFDLANMNSLGANATTGNGHRVSNLRFGHGRPHLAQVPDERVHGLPPEAFLQLNRFPHLPFLALPHMAPMMGYQGPLPLQPNFVTKATQMVVNPYLQSPGGSVCPHQSTPFNPAMNDVPISGNPFSVNMPIVSTSDHKGATFPARPIIPQTNLEVRPSNEDTTRMRTK
ncbi:hypothetical protein BWQ96_01096 [Gracilariopsis chorda]|uniref:Uncharacterized protein n=1 Tax=Gracilariopsis chorda TaxID=448386 RepID=A0A2V3J571_9FLOR|nr:hypothetical protein BWQ96_01096 [Gracilariopsis chorda]|eukprot:PXF49147.1 hypothetical protein BWQ96_01096 [Gracilariopsis chorda]